MSVYDCVADQRNAAMRAQLQWSTVQLQTRMRSIGRVAALIAREHRELARLIDRPNASLAEKLSSEIMPLADACRYTARRGAKVLAPQTLPRRDCPRWLGRVDATVFREPFGIVLVIAPANYPLFLPGVQIVQAVAAGNGVLVKPPPGGGAVLAMLVELLHDSGVPTNLVQVLPTDVEAASAAIDLGLDKVFLTGSYSTGRTVAEKLAGSLTPATMELSGCDPVFVLPDANLDRVAKALAFGLKLNGGATCIAPRRVFVAPAEQAKLEPLLIDRLAEFQPATIDENAWPAVEVAVTEAIRLGARLVAGQASLDVDKKSIGPIVLADVTLKMALTQRDLAVPVLALITVTDMTTAIALNRACPYALGASVFGSAAAADQWLREIDAGCITVNDLIVPTADPRVSFGGLRRSGYGKTRGLEGLLEMTRSKVICTRKGNWLPHLDRPAENLESALGGLLKLTHGATLSERLSGLTQVLRSLWNRRS